MPANSPQLVGELNYVTATGMVNEIRDSANFLKNLMFPARTEEVRSTETVELTVVTDEQEMAPFVKVDGQPISVPGIGYTYQTVTAPNIAISRPMSPSELMFSRRPNAPVYPSNSQQNTALRSHVARELAKLTRMVENREEWMVAEGLTMTLDYLVEDQAAWTITFPRAVSLSLDLGGGSYWDEASVDPMVSIGAMQRNMHREAVLNPSIMILGQEAADEWEVNAQLQGKLDLRNYETGLTTLMRNFLDSGARYMGTTRGGLQVVEYSRQMKNDAGVLTDLIDPKYAYLINNSPAAEMEMNYGAIPNLKLMLGGNPSSIASLGRMRVVPAKRFSDIELIQKPSQVEASLFTRPLPVFRRPNCVAEMKVISG